VRFRSSANARSMRATHGSVAGRVLRSARSVPRLDHVQLPAGVSVEEALARYGADPSVAYAEPNYLIELAAVPTDPSFSQMWALDNTGQDDGTLDADIDAPEAWDIETGDSSVVVAVIDSGVDFTHPDLAANMFANPGECDGDDFDDDGNGYIDDCHGIDAANDDSIPQDDNDHGTHVAGTIGAVGNNGVGVVGVAQTVRILACKFLGGFGSGATSDAIECFDYIHATKLSGINVVASNNSWASQSLSLGLADAIAAQTAAGILTIAAAGNSGTEGDLYPASIDDPGIIAVAATTRDDALSSFSNSGAVTVHLGAPGSAILSTVPSGGYAVFSGTSMASPHVAGAVALLAAQDPGRDWIALRNLLVSTGDPLAALAQTVSGRRLNVHRALTCTSDTLLARLRPASAHVVANVDVPVRFSAIHVQCGAPNGDVTVNVEPGATVVSLVDDGAGQDFIAGDGVYSGQWTPAALGSYTVEFPGGDDVVVDVTQSVLLDPTPGVFDMFGFALATDGGRVLVGAPRDDAAGPDAGAAYLYDGTTGEFLQALFSPAPDSADLFGEAVDLRGNLAVVGAALADGTVEDEGAAYLYDATTGALLHSFVNPSPGTGDEFGLAVALTDHGVFVGAYLDDALGENAGRGYLFDSTNGALIASISDPTPLEFDGFGYAATALDGGAAITTVYDEEPLSGARIAMVKRYDFDPISPTFGDALFTYDIGAAFQQTDTLPLAFGWSLAGSGNRLLIGDPFALVDAPEYLNEPGNVFATGAAFVYDADSGGLVGVLHDPAPKINNFFGWSVGIDGRWAVVGAPQSDVAAAEGGAGYLFDIETGDMRLSLLSPKPDEVDILGEAVTIGPSGAFVASIRDDTAQVDGGAVYRFDMPPLRGAQKCYRAKGGKPAAQESDVVDPFGALTLKPSGTRGFCSAVARESFGAVDGDAHLVCYTAKSVTGSPPFVERTIKYGDSFGVREMVLRKPAELCIPAAVDGGSTSTLIDGYTCYKAKPPSGAPRFVRAVSRFTDAFEDKDLETVKPDTFCTASSIDGVPAGAPDDHLACYRIRDAKGEPKFPGTQVAAIDDLLSQTIDVSKASRVCVPARIIEAP